LPEALVSCRRYVLPALVAFPLVSAGAQTSGPSRRLEILPTAGYLSFGSYFTGPAGIRFTNQDGFGYGAQFGVVVWRNLSVVGSVLHGTSDWVFRSVPLLGTVTVESASLWFFDVSPRVTVPLDATGTMSLVAQVGAGAIRYAVDNPLFTGRATNLAFTGGAGMLARLGSRVSLLILVKDYIASFRSVDDAAAWGVRGRQAHTVAMLLGLGLGW
jgi:hypothetical protein